MPRLRILAVSTAAMLAALVSPALAQPDYTFDVDPIRLGNKALEEGRLDDATARFNEAIEAGYRLDRAAYGLAGIAVREGRYAQSDSLYRRALSDRLREEKSAEFPEAHAGLGLLRLRLGDFTAAEQELNQALAERDDLWPALYGRARLLLNEGKWDEARDLLDRGAGKRGVTDGEDLYHYGMALYHLGQGDLAAAEKEALIAFSLAPWDSEYGTLVARIYEEKGVPSLAIDAYRRALATPGMAPTAPLLHSLGHLYQEVQRYTEARDAYLQAVAVDSTYTPALRDLADLFRRAGQTGNEVKVLLSYLEQEPDDADALIALSTASLATGKTGQALEAARRAMAVDSTRVAARLVLGRAGIRNGDGDTRRNAARLLAALPDSVALDAEDLLLLGAHQAEAKQYDRAADTLDRALAAAPDSPDVRFRLGMVYMRTGRPDSAAARLEEALDLNPGSALYALNLGVAYLQAGRNGEAIPALRRALGIDSTLTIGRVLLGQALIMSDSLAAAEAQYDKVLEAEPGNAKALRGLGFCHIRNSDYDAAAASYRRATKAEPDNADGWAGLGTAYLGLQNWDAAETALHKAKSLDPGNATARKSLELLRQARSGQGGG